MKILETCRYLKEMSVTQKRAIAELQNNAPQRILHLLKLFFYRNTPEFRHWCKEIATFSSTPRLKPSNQLPKKELIYRCIWTERKDSLSEQAVARKMKLLSEDYADWDKQYSYRNLMNFLAEFMQWQSTEMSLFDDADADDIRSKVTDLLIKYPLR